jgi:hypothetical protein
MLLELSIMLLELSITLPENMYSKGITYNGHLRIVNIFIGQATDLHLPEWP